MSRSSRRRTAAQVRREAPVEMYMVDLGGMKNRSDVPASGDERRMLTSDEFRFATAECLRTQTRVPFFLRPILTRMMVRSFEQGQKHVGQ